MVSTMEKLDMQKEKRRVLQWKAKILRDKQRGKSSRINPFGLRPARQGLPLKAVKGSYEARQKLWWIQRSRKDLVTQWKEDVSVEKNTTDTREGVENIAFSSENLAVKGGRVGTKSRKTKVKEVKLMKESEAVMTVRFTFGNTFVNLHDFQGNTLQKLSAGSLKPLKKSAAFTGLSLGEKAGKMALKEGIRKVDLVLYGLGRSRKTFFKGLRQTNLEILRLTLKPGLAHNGCRPPKKRRL